MAELCRFATGTSDRARLCSDSVVALCVFGATVGVTVSVVSGRIRRPENFMSATGTEPTEQGLSDLLAEHRRLDERLRDLDEQLFLTSLEQVEVQRLKKLKLLTKDRIERMRVGPMNAQRSTSP